MSEKLIMLKKTRKKTGKLYKQYKIIIKFKHNKASIMSISIVESGSMSIPIVESGSMCSTFSAFKFFNRFCNQEIK